MIYNSHIFIIILKIFLDISKKQIVMRKNVNIYINFFKH